MEGDSYQIDVNRRELLCIEFPGVVHNTENALESLEGVSNVKEILSAKSESQIKLFFNKKDPFSNYVKGNINKKCGVLLKKEKRSDGKVILRSIGVVKRYCNFDQLCDYYFIPPKSAREQRSVDNLLADDFQGTPYIPPAIFTRNVSPFAYRFDCANQLTKGQSESQRDDGTTEKAESVNEQNDIFGSQSSSNIAWNVVWKFSNVDVPCSPTEFVLKLPVDEEYQKLLTALFDERPMWLRSTLENRLPDTLSSWKKKSAFGKICFHVSDGPWRGCLCRFGYDPRVNKESCFYQTIDFRDPFFRSTSYKFKSSQNDQPADNSVDVYFRRPPSRRTQLYQLCDIDDKNIQEEITNAAILNECNKLTGWFQRELLSRIRDLLTVKSQRLRNTNNFI